MVNACCAHATYTYVMYRGMNHAHFEPARYTALMSYTINLGDLHLQRQNEPYYLVDNEFVCSASRQYCVPCKRYRYDLQ